MKAVIPVAKKKESLFPFSESRPAGLMPVMGKSLVKHLIQELQAIGVKDIYLVTNYLEDRFEKEFHEYTNVNLVHQEDLTGTAEALKTCDFIEEDFLVVNGDVMVSENDLENLKKKHEDTGGITLLATEENRPEKFGVLSITHDRVERIEEKPDDAENPLVNTGIYIFTPEIFDAIEQLEKDETSVTDAVSRFTEDGEVRYELVDDYWIDIGSPRKLWKADQIKREYEINEREVSEDAEISETAEIGEKVVIREGATVQANSVVEDKAFIGEGAEIGPNTVVRDSSISGECFLEHCHVNSSLLFDSVEIDSFVDIEMSVLGEEVDIKPGTIVRNSFIGPRSFIEMNNSIRDVKFVPDARTDLGEISK